MRNYPDWITAFLEYTENTEPPRMFREWVAISTIAAAMQRKCFMEWAGTKSPNMYIALVSPPGKARKNTAMYPGIRLLGDLGIPIAPDDVTIQSLIADLASKEIQSTTIDPDTGQYFTHSSLSIYAEELAAFLTSGDPKFIRTLVSIYDTCKASWVKGTKTQGKDIIPNVWINIIGGMTPDMMEAVLPTEVIGSGLTARMIFVYEEDREKRVPVPIETEKEREIYKLLLNDLSDINTIIGQYRVTPSFIDAYSPWYINQENDQPFEDRRFAYYFARRPTHLVKLCMIVAASESNARIITDHTFKRALGILQRTEIKMKKALGSYGMIDEARVLDEIQSFITQKGKTSLMQILNEFYSIADRNTIFRICGALEEMGFSKFTRIGKDWIVEVIQK